MLRAWDLSVAQFEMLAQIRAREGLCQQEVADRLLVTKGNISQLLARLVRRGLVRRCQEGRSMALFLTDEERALHARVLTGAGGAGGPVFCRLPARRVALAVVHPADPQR